MTRGWRWLPGLLAAGLASSQAPAQTVLTLEPSQPGPARVGVVVTWTAKPATGDSADFRFRFRTRRIGAIFQIVKDFGPDNSFEWTAAEHEGTYEIEAAARRRAGAGETLLATSRFAVQPNTLGDKPALTLTRHPLVMLYSTPPCDPPGRMKVRFQSADGFVQETPYRDCADGLSMNFYLAGMKPAMQYFVYHTLDTGDAFEDGPVLTDSTGSLPELPESTVLRAAPRNSPYPIVLQELVFAPPVAVDLEGNIVWFYTQPINVLTRPEPGGYFWGIAQDFAGDQWKQAVRLVDLIGLTVRETNAGRINEQLAALGKRPIGGFHHDALRLPDGNIALLAGVENWVTGDQGPGRVNVLGDMILVLDQNLRVVWTWDGFDHLDTKRQATLGELCNPQACPPLFAAKVSNDWTHSNSLQQTPDGNLLLSVRNLDWVVKIAYNNGEGDGRILWKLGKDGDFALSGATDSYPWFSHQHDARYVPGAPNRIMILDNGNLRRDSIPAANTRGQIFELDETARTARLALNADLGRYSLALGSTQQLPNGNYFFVAGFLTDASGISLEVDAAGKPVFELQTRAPVYRSYRLPSMYGPAR